MAKTTVLCLMDPLRDDLYTALGKLAVRYGQLEHVIALTMKRHDESKTWEQIFIQAKDLGRTQSVEEAQKRYGIVVMDQSKEGELLEQFERATDLVWGRHQVIHAIWAVTKDTQQLVANHNGDPIPDKPETIEKLAEELWDVVQAVNGLSFEPVSTFASSVECSLAGTTSLTKAALDRDGGL